MSAFRNACGWFPVDRPGGVAELITSVLSELHRRGTNGLHDSPLDGAGFRSVCIGLAGRSGSSPTNEAELKMACV